MTSQLSYAWLLTKRLLLMLGVYGLFRLLFLLFNIQFFSDAGLGRLLFSFIAGLRFDISAIIYVNSLFIILSLLPFNFRRAKGYQLMLKWIYFLFNFVALFFGLVDFKWFSYVRKRTTFDIFGTSGDMITQLPSYIRDFWYLLIVFAAIIWLTNWCYKRIVLPEKMYKNKLPVQTFVFIFFMGGCIIGARGGLQLKPITPINASTYVNSNLVPLVLNTPFNIILSAQGETIKPQNYFSDEQRKQLFNIQQTNNAVNDSSKHQNVIVIIWESLSRYFVGSLNNGRGYTPFFDSLAQQGLLCTNASANAHRSVEGIPAVTASLPTLMPESFLISRYQQDKIEGLPAILKKFGYSSVFLHGANNGSMGFDAFAPAAGYEAYYGRNEYPNKADYDGTWGIWDEPFLQYSDKILSGLKEPFCGTIFTLTSHFPFKVPGQYEKVFKKEKNDYSQVMKYSDYSLKKFFETASKQSWYKNTLFVIVADHGAQYDTASFYAPHGYYAIPILFYKPDGSLKGTFDKPAQQVDIMPSIIQYLNLPCKFVSFGKSIFSKDSVRYVYNYLNGVYHIEDNQYHLEFDGTKTIAVYDYKKDPVFLNNLIGQLPEEESRLENKLKAVIQTYNDAMINNRLMPE